MSLSLIVGCVWVLAATCVAFLPFRAQFPPGIALLVLAPVLLAWIGWENGIWVTLAGTLAFVSMFRNPLIYFLRRAFGKQTESPT